MPNTPTHLQSTVDLLGRAFGQAIAEPAYMALLAVLADHMSEENIGIAVAHQFGRNVADVTNDLAKVQSIHPPSAEAVEAVRDRLRHAGFEDWLMEDEQ